MTSVSTFRMLSFTFVVAVALAAVTACGGGESRDVSEVFEQRVPGAGQAPALVFVFTDN